MKLCQHTECIKKRKQEGFHVQNLEYWEQELHRLHRQEAYRIKWSAHVDIRESDRSVLSWQTQEALFHGSCIGFVTYQHPKFGLTHKWTWLWYVKMGPGLYRPLHLVLMVNPEILSKRITVTTVYDPSMKSWMWDPNYIHRICWKDKE